MSVVRFRHLTKIGVRRCKCDVEGCNNKGYAQWNICADKVGNRTRYRVVCADCDIEINRIVMGYMFGFNFDTDCKIAEYTEKVRRPH